MQLIFLAGGKGTRMQLEPLGVKKKCLVPLKGIPLLGHLIKSLKNHINSDLATVFVIPKNDNSIIEYVRGLKIKAEFVEQEKPDGVVNAMLLAKNKLMTNEGLFILADIVLKGEVGREWQINQKKPSLFIWDQAPNSATQHNFGVKINSGKIVSVIEKPSRTKGLHCGMGMYFFNEHVLSLLEKAPVNPKSKEVEITDALSYCITKGIDFQPIIFEGYYSNINTLKDLRAAELKT